jgi:hypothetical protein
MREGHTISALRIVPVGLTLSSFLLVTYIVCILFGLVVPEQFTMHEAWAPLLPGFEWLTPTGFIAGAIGAFAYGWYIAVIFVPLWRFFNRRGNTPG